MKIIFWGTPEVGIPCLNAIVQHGHTVCAVVTQPDKEQGRNRQPQPSPIKAVATALGILVLQPETPNTDEFATILRQLAPDAMVVVAYGKLFAKKLLGLAPHGYLNVHFSLLPKYRGASPVLAAILAGEKESGVAVMKLVPKMDAGPVLSIAALPIQATDTTDSLEAKLADLGARLLMDVLGRLGHGPIAETPQDDTQATFCKIIAKEAGLVNWTLSAEYLERFVRAMQPWPTAYTFLAQTGKNKEPQRIILRATQVLSATSEATPGTVVAATSDSFDVATGHGCLRIVSLQKAGKSILHASEFLRGNRIVIGDQLGTGKE